MALDLDVESTHLVLLDTDRVRVTVYRHKRAQCVLQSRIVTVRLNFLNEVVDLREHISADAVPELGQVTCPAFVVVQTCINVAFQRVGKLTDVVVNVGL